MAVSVKRFKRQELVKGSSLDHYLVKVRFFGEERDIREFIQPRSAPVLDVAEGLPADKDQAVRETWGYIARNIIYPPVKPYDYRYQEAFTSQAGAVKVFEPRVALISETRYDYWQMPAETLAEGLGDCEDMTFVGVSVLRNRLSADEVFATIGLWEGYGHAWITVLKNGQALVFEPTRSPQWPLRLEAPDYEPFVRFNDVSFREIRSGLLAGARPRCRVELSRLKKAG